MGRHVALLARAVLCRGSPGWACKHAAAAQPSARLLQVQPSKGKKFLQHFVILITLWCCVFNPQIQPSKDVIVEFIKNDDFKYLRLLGALRLPACWVCCCCCLWGATYRWLSGIHATAT